MIRITKIYSLTKGNFQGDCVFAQTPHRKNDEIFCKLLIFKDGTPAVQTD